MYYIWPNLGGGHFENTKWVKAAPCDDINFRFYFRTEVVYLTDHVFIFFNFLIFL